MSNNEIVDLNKLSQKELLIRLMDHVKNIEDDLDEYKTDMTSLKVRLAVLETKAAIYGGLAGFVIGLIMKLVA